MKFLIGNKETFGNFLAGISRTDKIAIATHKDLDGIASAIFAEEILKQRKCQVNLIEFMSYKKDTLDNLINKLDRNGITTLFILDMSADDLDIDMFEHISKKYKTLLIDHHPPNEKARTLENVIKTNSADCCAVTLYRLGKDMFDNIKWTWLVLSAMVSDVAYKSEENMRFIQKYYPKTNITNIQKSRPAKIANIISSALIYYTNTQQAYDIIRTKKINRLKASHRIIESQIRKWVKKYDAEAEFYPDKNLYLYHFNPRYSVNSIVLNKVCVKHPGSTFISVTGADSKEIYVKINARNQSQNEDMGALMKKGVCGLDNATGGGHVSAAAALIMKKDLDKFVKNILS